MKAPTRSTAAASRQPVQHSFLWKEFLRPLLAPAFLGLLAVLMCVAFTMKALAEIPPTETGMLHNPLVPLFLFSLLLIALLTMTFASLKMHIYWLHKQEKLAVEKSSFVRMASDTLRTPLTGLSWVTELMLSGDFGNITSEQKESMTNMGVAIKRVISLVNELLEVMRLSGSIINYNPQPTDVALLIKESVKDMSAVAGAKRLHIGFGQISHDVLIMMDEPLIRHVLGSLLTGAVHLAKIDTTIVMHAEPTLQKIAVGITYTGPKMTFKNFDSTEKAVQKSALPTNIGNLDLTISWEILNAAKGEFWTVDRGDDHTLFIGLPLLAAPAGSVATKSYMDADVAKFLKQDDLTVDPGTSPNSDPRS